MSANELSLTFLLKADGSQATAEIRRLTAQISSQLAGLNRPNDGAAAAAIGIQRQQAQVATQIQREVTASVVNETRARTVATQTAARGELTVRQQLAAAASLQRQRSAALIAQWRQEERAALQAAAGTKSFKDVLQQLSASVATFQGPLGAVSGRISSLSTVVGQSSAGLSSLGASASGAGSSIAAIAGPIGIALVAIAALGAGAILVTKEIFGLAKASADYQGKLFDLSQQVGVSVETLSALEVVARTTGGSIESLTASLGIFQRNLEEASEDIDSKAAKAFNKLGVETLDTESALRQTIVALARMPEGFKQTAAALEVFGRGGKAFLAIAKEANGDIDEITRRLKDLGLVTTEQAKLADEFNDQLVLLDVQLRGIGTQAIPVVLDVLKDLSRLLAENRDLITFVQGGIKGVAQAIAVPLRFALASLKSQFDIALPALKLTAETFERIAEAIGFISKNPTKSIESGQATPTEQPDDFTKQQQEKRNALLKLQGVLNFDFAAQQRTAQSAIAEAQRAFEAGQSTRQEFLEATIAGLKKRTKAEVDALQAERQIKLTEAALAKDDLQKQTQIGNQILAIDTQIADKRHQLKEREKDERAKFRKEEETNELAHQQRLLERSTALDQVKITGIQQQIALGTKAALDGDKEIENIELTAIDRAQNVLVKRLESAGQNLAKQGEITDQIKKLDIERTATEQRHSNQRLQIVTTEAEIVLQRIQVKGEALIATTQALATARVITEQEAEKRIAKVRLDALDAEIELAKARGQDTRLLEDQRAAFQAQTERDIEAGRRKDLQNERRYADELRDIKRQIVDVERSAVEEELRLMVLNFASRKAVIRQRLKNDIDDENARHAQALEAIRSLERENRESNKTKKEKLEFEKEINRLGEEELRRHNLEEAAINAEAKQQAVLASPFGGLFEGLATGQLAELTNGVQAFADIAKVAFSAVGAVVNQLASGIGSLVQNFVLLGANGPNAFRKLIATVLAGVAAQAATLAIMETAYGIAALTPWGAAVYGAAPLHFKSAALFASIALVTGLAGRGAASGLFTQNTASTGASSSQSQGPDQLNPLTLNRNQPPTQMIIVEIRPDGSKFGQAITAHILKEGKSAGNIREFFANDSAV